MQIIIEACGPARQWLGQERVTLNFESSSPCVRDALAVLGARHPPFAAQRRRCAYALGERIVDDSAPLTDGALLSLIPPVSGG